MTADSALPIRKLAFDPNGIPQGLKDARQWMLWDPNAAPGDQPKAPRTCRNGTIFKAAKTDVNNYLSFEEAVDIATKRHLGIGFVLTERIQNGIVAIDVDGRRGSEYSAADIESWQKHMMALASYIGTYVETSPSGIGLHMFGFGSLPMDGRNVKPYEIYAAKRFITVTGHRVPWSPLDLQPIPQDKLDHFVDTYFPNSGVPEIVVDVSAAGHTDPNFIPVPIETLLSRNRDVERLLELYRVPNAWETMMKEDPQEPGKMICRYTSQSSADFYLMKELARATNLDVAAMDYYFRRSAQMREKYDGSRGELSWGQVLIRKVIEARHKELEQWRAKKAADNARLSDEQDAAKQVTAKQVSAAGAQNSAAGIPISAAGIPNSATLPKRKPPQK